LTNNSPCDIVFNMEADNDLQDTFLAGQARGYQHFIALHITSSLFISLLPFTCCHKDEET
jgi:hypothetical protein